jgi:hypothetical protein
MNINILIVVVLILMIILKINNKLNIDTGVLFFICILVLLLLMVCMKSYEHFDINAAQIYSDNNMIIPQLKIIGDLEIGGKLKVNTSKNASSISDPILRVYANAANKIDYYAGEPENKEHVLSGNEIDRSGNIITDQMRIIFANLLPAVNAVVVAK